jgi:hypothetical protein
LTVLKNSCSMDPHSTISMGSSDAARTTRYRSMGVESRRIKRRSPWWVWHTGRRLHSQVDQFRIVVGVLGMDRDSQVDRAQAHHPPPAEHPFGSCRPGSSTTPRRTDPVRDHSSGSFTAIDQMVRSPTTTSISCWSSHPTTVSPTSGGEPLCVNPMARLTPGATGDRCGASLPLWTRCRQEQEGLDCHPLYVVERGAFGTGVAQLVR